MNQILRQTVRMGGLAVLMASVAACGTSRHVASGPGGPIEPGPGDPDPQPTALFAEDVGTASQALAAGETLQTQELTAGNRNASPNSPVAPDFAISRNEDGGVDVTIAGQTYAFTDQDVDGSGWERRDNGDYAGLFSWNDSSVDSVLDEDSDAYAQIWTYFLYDSNSDSLTDGFAVVGTETTAAAVQARTATAEYRGYATMRFLDTDANPDDRTDLLAGTPTAQGVAGAGTGLRMTANFDDGTISGELDGIVATRTPETGPLDTPLAVPGTVMMVGTDITGNGYQGALTGTVDGRSVDGTYSGKFFGANAQETAGVFTAGDEDGHGYGAYRAFEVQD